MTLDERIQAVVDLRFTERQARFLVLVMRHAGVCVPRQYASLAGIANGGKRCTAFFETLVKRGHAVGSDCVHNRARLYHLHSKRLARAHRRNHGKTMTETEAVAFVEAKRRARPLRRVRPYLASRP